MPIVKQSNWSDEVAGNELPARNVQNLPNGLKVITEYKINEDGKKVKVTRKFQSKTIQSSKAVADRKKLAKFGDCKGFPPGPDSNSTTIGDAVYLKLSFNSKTLDEPEEDPLKAVIASGNTKIVCRICKGDHWTNKCPFKDTYLPINEIAAKGESKAPAAAALSSGPKKYVPPSRRDGGATTGSTMGGREERRDDANTIRISNLSEDTTENDVRDLLHNLGSTSRVFVARDHQQNICKGFAFITFHDRQNAQNAINRLNGFGYDSLILRVDWAQKN
ncbi:translation initiation factor eIF3g [Globomyces pollinis-pini]|nr:translation initiation factor eIF3g [Globomyces pollinis-pini]